MKTADTVFDLYDDPKVQILREHIQGELPTKIASMELLSAEERNRLPDRLFALVTWDGTEQARKYAMHDEPHLLTSLLYFSNQAATLPEEAQKVAAHNLCLGCEWYGVEPPEDVVKLAGEVGTDWVGELDVSALQAPSTQKVAAAENFAFGAQYPIESLSQIKEAQAYFDENWGSMTPLDRHVFATNLQDRATEVGEGHLGGLVGEYAGYRYGAKIAGELSSRVRMMDGKEHQPVYALLREKVASIDPLVMAEMLTDADKITGIADSWNAPYTGCLDPYRAVFSKQANDANPSPETNWSWSEGSDHVTDTILWDYARNYRIEIAACFGDDFANDFCDDPIETFESLPDPQKHAIARMANTRPGNYHKG